MCLQNNTHFKIKRPAPTLHPQIKISRSRIDGNTQIYRIEVISKPITNLFGTHLESMSKSRFTNPPKLSFIPISLYITLNPSCVVL